MADPGRRPGPNAVAALVLVAVVAALLLWQRPWHDSGDGARADFPSDAPARLAARFTALTEAGSEREFVTAAGSSRRAEAFARRTWRAREAIGATDVRLRYVSGGVAPDREDGSAVASVDVSWRTSGAGDAQTAIVAFRVAPQDDGDLSVVGAGPREGALPIWLAGALDVEESSGARVVRLDGGDARLPVGTMAVAARSAVTRLVPGATGRLTVVSPHTQAQMAHVVGQPVEQVRQIAAVTTRLGGEAGSARDDVIVLNPTVFATMDRRAAQVVVTHEATHLLTRAVGTRSESWVVEGFADFVALHDDSAPLAVSAGQILTQVRADGAPRRLPAAEDFGAEQHGLGAVYESAWMAFRLLGERHGDAAVVDFYDAVMTGTPLDDALDASFGLTVDELTDQWRAYLAKSASTVS